MMNRRRESQSAATARNSPKGCSRCKKRKTKCDSAWPSCGACAKAGAVCRAYNSGGQDDLPRSLVRALEDQLAQLERQAAELQHSPENIALALKSKLAHATLSADTSSPSPFFLSSLSAPFFLRPSCLPLSVSKIKPRISPPSRNHRDVRTPPRDGPSMSTNLGRIPPAAIEQMLWNYTNIHLPQYPCVEEGWLRQVFVRILDTHGGDTDAALTLGMPANSSISHFDYFIGFIVLAISSMTLTWKNETQARTASDAFFASSLQHLRLILDVTQVQRLQISLLLAHYAQLNPSKIDNWTCIWNATRVVLELGLCKRSSGKVMQDQAALRNELFWVTYGMERSLCTILKLPLSFAEETITAPPHLSLSEPITVDDAAKKKSSATHLYRLHALEIEVHRVLFLQDATAQGEMADLDHWTRDVSRRLDEWLEGANDQFGLEFKTSQCSGVRSSLYRPTPRAAARAPHHRRLCLEACATLVADYRRQMDRRRLFYPWHAVHLLYEAALVSLEACWAARDHAPTRPLARRALGRTVPDCLALLAQIGQSWDDALLCSRFLAPLADDVTRALAGRGAANGVDGAAEADLTERLRKLLFPEGPSTWNTPSAAPSSSASAASAAAAADGEVRLPAPALAGDSVMVGGAGDGFDWGSDWNFLQELSPVFDKESGLFDE